MTPLAACVLFLLGFIVTVSLVEDWRDRREDRRIARWREAARLERQRHQLEQEAFGRYQAARDSAAAARLWQEAGVTGGEVEE